MLPPPRSSLFARLLTFIALLQTPPLAAQMVFGFEYQLGKSDSILVTSVYRFGPAEASGLKGGDLLRKWNNTSLTGLSREALQKVLSSAPATGNRFEIFRQGKPLQLTLGKQDFESFRGRCVDNCSGPSCTVELYNGTTVRGSCRNGKANGPGEMFHASGRLIYTGNFVDNQMQGQGTFYFDDSSVYVGAFSKSRLSGKGKRTFPNGKVYEGDFADNTYHGQGKLSWPDGNLYEGEFKEGNYSGQGMYRFANGWVYQGNWAQSKRQGKGVLRFPNGDRYEGDFADDQYSGTGVYTFGDGRKYVGEWRKDQKNGTGVFTWPNGDRYEGEFRDDQINGQGVYRYADGREYRGAWVKGLREGNGVLTGADGDIYTGGFQADKKHGKGTRFYGNKDGRRFEGEYRNDELYQGTLRLPSGSVYTGYFKNGKSDGEGKGVYSDGTVIQGSFVEGKPWNAVKSFPDGRQVVIRSGQATGETPVKPAAPATASTINTASVCKDVQYLIGLSRGRFLSIRNGFERMSIGDSVYRSSLLLANARSATIRVQPERNGSAVYTALLLDDLDLGEAQRRQQSIADALKTCLTPDYLTSTTASGITNSVNFKPKNAARSTDPAIVSVNVLALRNGRYALEIEVRKPDEVMKNFLDRTY